MDNDPIVFASESPVAIAASTPEPSTFLLLGAGLFVVAFGRRGMLYCKR